MIVNLNEVYALARSMPYSEFKATVGWMIDNIPITVENNNEYVLVNKTKYEK